MRASLPLLAFLVVARLFAQTPHPGRPRIGLVLEGGGALGFAHIGAIEYLEEHHIPIDLIAGTSMGGLVGGLYASGRSPTEIRALIDKIDWPSVLSGGTGFQDLSYRRKEDRIAYPNRLEFGIKKRSIALPGGLNAGHQVGLIFDESFLPYYDLKDFDALPTPFRCVATDMTTGREKVFDRGSLSQALRATMSIPGLFAPAIIDGHAYTDGGALDNLPVAAAKEAGAEVIIAVYLDTGTVNPQSDSSFLAVAGRTISIMIAANELRSMKMADILLNADLSGFTSASFESSKEIIPKGYGAAREKQKLLAALSLDDRHWAEYVAARKSRIRTAVPAPQFVRVEGKDSPDNREIREELSSQIAKPLNTEYVAKTLTRITGIGGIGTAGYSLVDQDGETGLAIRTGPKTYGPPFVNLGVAINGADVQDVQFGLSGRLTWTNLGGFRSELRTDAFFGSSYGVASEYYRPFTATSKWFVAPRVYATSTLFDVYNNRDFLASQYEVGQDGFGVDVGYALNSRSEIRLGQDLLWFGIHRRISADTIPSVTERQEVTSLRYQYLGADNAVLPLRGTTLQASYDWHRRATSLQPFSQAEIKAAWFLPVSTRGSLFFTAGGGTSFGASVLELRLQSFTLGGPFRFGAYGLNELLGNQYLLFRSGYLRELLQFNPLFGQGLYAVAFAEGGKVFNDFSGPSLPFDGSLALVARTALGPMFVGASVGASGHRKWWFGLGHVF